MRTVDFLNFLGYNLIYEMSGWIGVCGGEKTDNRHEIKMQEDIVSLMSVFCFNTIHEPSDMYIVASAIRWRIVEKKQIPIYRIMEMIIIC